MAVVVFSGGHAIEADAPASEIVGAFSSQDGFVLGQWVTVDTGAGEIHINPEQIAYITDESIPEEEGPHGG